MDRAPRFGRGGWGFESSRVCIMSWYLYIVKCSDDTLYTGITTDITRRIKTHNKSRGSKYVRTRLPVELVYSETLNSQTEAIKREIFVKTWSRERKLKLISTHISEHQ